MGLLSWLKGSADNGENPYQSPNPNVDKKEAKKNSSAPEDLAEKVRRKFTNLHSRESGELMMGAMIDWGMRGTRCHVADTVSDSEILSAVIDLYDPNQREYMVSLKREKIIDQSKESGREHVDLAWLDQKKYDQASPGMLMLHADFCAISGRMEQAKILYQQALRIARERGLALNE